MIEVKISKQLNYEQGVEKSARTNKIKLRIHNMRGAVRTYTCTCSESIAEFGRLIATKCVNAASLEAYIACRLVPLDKRPGVRPVGIG